MQGAATTPPPSFPIGSDAVIPVIPSREASRLEVPRGGYPSTPLPLRPLTCPPLPAQRHHATVARSSPSPHATPPPSPAHVPISAPPSSSYPLGRVPLPWKFPPARGAEWGRGGGAAVGGERPGWAGVQQPAARWGPPGCAPLSVPPLPATPTPDPPATKKRTAKWPGPFPVAGGQRRADDPATSIGRGRGRGSATFLHTTALPTRQGYKAQPRFMKRADSMLRQQKVC